MAGLPTTEVLTGDGAIVEVGAELHWQVVHSVRYVTRVKEVDATVGALCQQCLASLLGCSDQDDLDRRREAIEATLLASKSLSLKSKACHGGKCSKDQLTALLCFKMDSSDELKLWVIGKSKNPQCLKNICLLPCYYRTVVRG
ncbi:hypothetical protein HPB51_029435 [Rhipicephalus microplus]|uniref:DDE-1 domain-containing protein n=1 Tax=Rhipicephalus microplus TaxID=6941 RepID=A0A9J6CUT4_RHIMP|nr:hypothetical protein HPB51_029435 [Rhipicephalus microplus]